MRNIFEEILDNPQKGDKWDKRLTIIAWSILAALGLIIYTGVVDFFGYKRGVHDAFAGKVTASWPQNPK